MQKKKRKPFSLYLRNGVYYVRLWDENAGKYTASKSTHQTDRDLAAGKAKDMIKAGTLKKRDEDSLFTDALFSYWQNRKDLSPKYKIATIRNLKKHLLSYKPLSKLRLSQITPGKVNRFTDYMDSQGLSPRVINRILQSLKTYFNYAYTREYINIDIAGRIIRKKERPKERGELTIPEILKIVDLSWPDHRLKVAVLLGCFAGLRKGEIRALRWRDVDFNTNYIHVRQNFTGDYDESGNPIFKEPKSDSRREWPYMTFPELRQALLEQWEQTPFKGPDDLVLPNVWGVNSKNGTQARTHTPLPDTAIKRNYSKMLEAIGIDNNEQDRRRLVFHSTRHSFTSFIDMSGSSKTAMSLTGHSTREMLENYSHANNEAVIKHIESANMYFDRFRKRA